jgi:long-chain acyl-CoA synthetase
MENSVIHLLLNSIRNFPDKDVLRYKKNGNYQGITYQEFGQQIEVLTYALQDMGLQSGDRIAILSYNRPAWPLSDFAIFSMRGITVPIYHTLPPNQICYILKDCGARAIFVENQLQYEKIRQIRSKCPELEWVFCYDMLGESANETVSLDQLTERGKELRRKNPEFYQDGLEKIDPGATCSIVYTSGTTGNPKGVMLHHRGFVVDIINSEGVFGIYPDDVFLSFLPLSHLYERLGGHWCPMYRGATIGYAEDITTVIDDIQQVRPTVMVSVPRLYEKISNAVMEQVESGSALKKTIFFRALKNGRKYQQRKHDNTLNGWVSFKNNLAEKLVFSKIKQKLGGRFRFPISGGAPLSTETLKFFEAMGLHIIEGYGMTETHLIITLTPPGSTKYGSCGKPIPDVEVRIADDGEILVRGVTVMSGYYQDPDYTAEIIDKDGWLHTGDVGYLDKDNYLYITDRKKNIIVTAGGKNVAPAPIENAIKLSRYIEDICVVGDRRKFVSAIIMPNYETLKRWATENHISFQSHEELVRRPEVEDLFMQEIERLQSEEARYEKVKKFILLAEPLTVEKGEITPSLKIRRKVVEEKFRNQIERLYAKN